MASRFLRILLQPLSYNLELLSLLFEVHYKNQTKCWISYQWKSRDYWWCWWEIVFHLCCTKTILFLKIFNHFIPNIPNLCLYANNSNFHCIDLCWESLWEIDFYHLISHSDPLFQLMHLSWKPDSHYSRSRCSWNKKTDFQKLCCL